MIRVHAIQIKCRVYRWRSIWANSLYPISPTGKDSLWVYSVEKLGSNLN